MYSRRSCAEDILSAKTPQADGSAGNEDNDIGSNSSSTLRNEHHWQGTCIHNFEVPRWVQKSRQIDSDSRAPIYIEPRRAVEVAVNARFSLVAVGTYRCVDVVLPSIKLTIWTPTVDQSSSPPAHHLKILHQRPKLSTFRVHIIVLVDKYVQWNGAQMVTSWQ